MEVVKCCKYKLSFSVMLVEAVQQHPIQVVIIMPHVMGVPVSVMLGTTMMLASASIMLERVHYVSTDFILGWCWRKLFNDSIRFLW